MDVEIPDVALTPFVLSRALELGDRTAYIEGSTGRRLSFADVHDGVHRLAGALRSRGFVKGDVLAILGPNMPEYAVALHGALLAGGAVTTINPVYNVDEVVQQLSDAGAKILVTVPGALERARAAADRTAIDEIFVIGEDSWADLLTADPITDPPSIDPGEDLAVLPYSSGTTGSPKGVMLTHRNLVANLVQCLGPLGTDDDETIMGVLPFFHIYGMTVILNLGLISGTPVVTMARFDLEEFLRLITEHEITRVYVVPPIALALANHPLVDDHDTSSIRMIMSGAAPLGEDLERATAERVGCQVSQGYGMTESSPVSCHTGRVPMPPAQSVAPPPTPRLA